MQIATCGSFQATCTSTSQCATNICANGLCGGPLLLFPGAECTPFSKDPSALPCAFGASCYATNSMLITRCGNFQAECTWDYQCAYNSCQGGFCNGVPLSSSSSSSTVPLLSMSPSPTTGSTTTSISIPAVKSSSAGASSTNSVLRVSGTVTGTVVGGGQSSAGLGPSQTPRVVQSSGAGRAIAGAITGACAIGMVVIEVLM
jgi:hypothetical protein